MKRRYWTLLVGLLCVALWHCDDEPNSKETDGGGVEQADGSTGRNDGDQNDWAARDGDTAEDGDLSAEDCLAPGIRRECATGLPGVCAQGGQTCQGNLTWSECTPAVQVGDQTEDCGNGLDDDCDGNTDGADSDCAVCTAGQTENCAVTGAQGICAQGTRTCTSAGAWGPCSGPSPQIEDCGNGQDDDCDGYGDSSDPDCTSGCALPWGGTLAHGQSVTAYEHSTETSPELCSNHAETRICQNGVLSGSYTQPACTQAYRDCALSGYGTLAHGAQVSTYDAASVYCGQTCTQSTITCNDGTLQGGTNYIASCSVQSCDCYFGKPGGMAKLEPGQSCTSDLVNINTSSGCSDGGQYYASYTCTYTCHANGVLTATSGAPCEMATDGACGGSYSSSSQSDCPDW